MKKHLVVAAGLAVLSTGAFASKARMQAMSQGSAYGSYYMYDTRNVWRTPHTMNSNPEFVITEWGTADNAEGGFFNSAANLNYGLYLNADAYTGNVQDGTGALSPQRFDLFVGGNAGMNWGARLGYQSLTQSANDEEASAFDFTVSADVSGANVWLSYISGADATISSQTETNADMMLGATYAMGDFTLFGEYSSEGNTGSQDASTAITLGAGKTMSMNDSATVFYDVKLVSTSNYGSGVNGFSQDASEMMVPVTFGVEAKATNWLTWRASLSQSILGTFEAANGDETSTKQTTLGVGASLMYGNLQLDGTIATAANGTLGYDNGGTDDDVMSNVSMTYTF
jgi:hypothetical protein